MFSRLKEEDVINEIKKDEELSNFFKKLYNAHFRKNIKHRLGSISGTYKNTPEDLLPVMLSLKKVLESSSIPFKTLAFCMSAKNHSIVFSFNTEEKNYRSIDSNKLNNNIVSLDSISKKIAKSYEFPGIEHKAFAIEAFISTEKNHISDVQRIFNNWKTSFFSNENQRLWTLNEDEQNIWLIYAILAGDERSESLLINKISNFNHCDRDGITPLYVAYSEDHEKTVQILLNKGANVNHSSKERCTPLGLACQNGHEKIVQILLNKGANVNHSSKEGCTPLDLACQNGHENIKQMLLEVSLKDQVSSI